jgi:hypothetical protein
VAEFNKVASTVEVINGTNAMLIQIPNSQTLFTESKQFQGSCTSRVHRESNNYYNNPA